MRTLITGGAGFIGSHLAGTLLRRGDAVSVIDDLSTGRLDNVRHLMENPRFKVSVDTITNETEMDRLASQCDLVYHLAAVVGVRLVVESPLRTVETNVMGTHAVLRAAARHGTKVILASSSEVYGKGEQIPFREDADRLLGPTTIRRWSYSASKAIDEFLGLAYHEERELPVVICRLFNTVGPRQTERYVVSRFARQAMRGQPVTVHGDGLQTRCFCDVRDAVRGIIALADCAEAVGEVVNVGNTREITITYLARKILELSGSESRVSYVPYEVAYGRDFEDLRRRVPDISKIGALTGWTPDIPLEETLTSIIRAVEDEPGDSG